MVCHMRAHFVTLALLALVGSAAAAALPVYAPDATVACDAIPGIYHWDLSSLFPSDTAWETARRKLLGEVPALAKYEGKLADPKALRECLDLYFRLHSDANFVTLYPNLRQSTAQSDDKAGAMVQSSLAAMDVLMQQASFIRREVLTLSDQQLAKAYQAQPGLAAHEPYLDNLRRRAARILSPDAERALALLGDNLWAEIDLNELPSNQEDAFNAILTDIPWPRVKDEQGREVQLTLSNYSRFRQSPDRGVREGAVKAFLGTLRVYQHALAATLAGQFELDVAYARARGYDTALAAYMDKDEVATAVHDNLIATVNANLPLMHRYVEMRKQALGVAEVHLYDLYVPLATGVDRAIAFPEARQTLLAGLAALGPEYGKVLAEGLDPASGWLDLYPCREKESGAFSSSVYGRHPYVFMNYQDSLDDMSTLAHEFGHALHSHLAMQAQPYSGFRYTTVLAEIASTCNEALLSDYLIAHAKDPQEKAYLLMGKLEDIRQTIFRQTMFSEFERKVHGFIEASTPVTATLLEQTYSDLIRKYYGPGFTLDPDDGLEWAYIPHFYYKYYVYSYATGLSSGIAIADRVRTLGQPAVDAYLEMLKGGCSAPPLELLAGAGVDLTKPDAIAAAMKTFATTLDEVEKLLR
jgi:oligoendopeptidase F